MISGSYTRRKTPSWCLGPEKQNILCKNILTKFLSSFFEINHTIFTTCKRKNTKMYSAAREKAIFTNLSGPRGELVPDLWVRPQGQTTLALQKFSQFHNLYFVLQSFF